VITVTRAPLAFFVADIDDKLGRFASAFAARHSA